jgi:hypothetical protein
MKIKIKAGLSNAELDDEFAVGLGRSGEGAGDLDRFIHSSAATRIS